MIRIEVEFLRGRFPVSVQIETAARVSGFFGPSGSGKTSLLLAVAGLLTPRRGRIEVGGTVLFDSARGVSLAPEQRRVGMVFQEGRLFPHLTVRENLRFPRVPPSVTGPGFDEVVALLDLEPLLERRPSQLSGGQGRLAAVGRALLARPRLLLLDEPLTGLDPALRRRVLAYLLRLRESLDVRMMLVSHVFSDFLSLVGEMSLMDAGTTFATGAPEELMGRALGGAGGEGVETTLSGRVVETAGGQAVVDCGGARLVLALEGARPGAEAYVTVGAQEVLLAVGEPPRTSARNALPGRVTRLEPAGPFWLAAVEVGPGSVAGSGAGSGAGATAGPTVWAEITEASRQGLGIEPGREVHLLIKSSALRGVVLGT